jgi:hypothetical protein
VNGSSTRASVCTLYRIGCRRRPARRQAHSGASPDGRRREALVAFWNKLNAAERMAGIGAIVVIVAGLLGLVSSYLFGTGWLPLLGGIAVLVIYYLKYNSTSNINWPAPIPTIVLVISAIVAVIAILSTLSLLSFITAFGSALGSLALIGTLVGAVIMVWGAWQDYQATPKTTPPA